MLKNTFIHVPGVNKDVEETIWRNQIHDWNSFLENHSNLPLPQNKKELIHNYIQNSLVAHGEQNVSFFLDKLDSKEHWRVYNNFKPCFLDIETTGLCKQHNKITTIGVYDGQDSKIFISGKNMHEFPEEINKYGLLITFNGKCFDLPFLKHHFPQINFAKFHIDLRYVMKDLGYTGGLKRIEQEIGISRGDELEGVDGREAVRLWYKYQQGDQAALDTLVKYNLADVVNLKTMMDFAYQKMRNKNFRAVIGTGYI